LTSLTGEPWGNETLRKDGELWGLYVYKQVQGLSESYGPSEHPNKIKFSTTFDFWKASKSLYFRQNLY
jgi:hypothetical protein